VILIRSLALIYFTIKYFNSKTFTITNVIELIVTIKRKRERERQRLKVFYSKKHQKLFIQKFDMISNLIFQRR